LNAADKSGSKAAVVGQGEHAYECDHNWGQLPASIEWQTTHGVTVDAAGLIYITHQGVGNKVMDTVVVFDPAGKYVRSFGKEYHKGGHGIDIRKEGGEEFIYLCHMSENGPVAKTTLKGELVWKKGPPEEAKVYNDKAKYRPTNLAFAPDGGFYVADGYGSNYVHRYDKDGKYLSTFGGTGNGPGQFRTPHGIWLDDRKGRQPQVVVADRANARLQYFDLAGKPAGEVTDVKFPAHFDIRGDVLLVPDLHTRVSLFDVNNKAIVHLGEDEAWRKKVVDSLGKGQTPVRTQPKEWPAGKFVHPHDACFDKDGNIFVAEWVQGGRISKLKKTV
jgi:DNA-binding beta-propeller fold protein YncE